MIRVAIIGAGIGAEHLAGYRAGTEFEVVAICDLDVARAKAMAGDIPVVTDMAEAVKMGVDVVDICLPPHLHVPFAIKALEAGCHVICEKPLGCSLVEVDGLITVAKATGKQVFPVFQYRYGTGLAKMRALIEKGLTGQAIAANAQTHWRREADYYAVPWRGTWAGEQGGSIVGHAIHIHDLLCQLLGPVARVSAVMDTKANPIETEDTAAINWVTDLGALVSSSVTLGAGHDESRLKIMFQGLTAESGTQPYALGADDWTFTARGASQQVVDQVVASVPVQPTGFAGFLRDVATAINGDRTTAVSLMDGRASIELITALYQADRQRAWVDLPIPQSSPMYEGWQPKEA
ncbi:Gfo/Idh/MocA family protein [Algirhabdus cladophorae]|uniref:Gfo/Idh/MocA family protein n=1 Tax=Algirhabdus cladophorae TaxID=3377108 RepID=UPI003B84A10D